MELHEVDDAGAEPVQRLIDLQRGGFGVAAVDLGHEEDALPVAILESLAHADLAGPGVVIPAVVEEGDAAVDGGADEADALLGIGLLADVEAAEADGGDAFAGAAELAIDHVGGFGAAGGSGPEGVSGGAGNRGGGGSGGGGAEEITAVHGE